MQHHHITQAVADTLSPDDNERYQRHIILPSWGESGQKTLRQARVMLVGLGGLGSPVAMYLAAAGIGCLGLMDPDRVALSNLQRQILHGDSALNQLKTDSAAARLRQLDSRIQLSLHPCALTADTLAFLHAYQLVICATDNLASRYLLADWCWSHDKPWIHGAVNRFEGQLAVFQGRNRPCYRCLFPEPPALEEPSPVAGVLGPLAGMIGCLQASEALKLLLGLCGEAVPRLLSVDLLDMRFKLLSFGQRGGCPCCGRAS